LIEDYENNGRVNNEAEKIWLSQHLNIEMGVGFADDGWRGADYWEGAADERLADLDELLARSEVVTFGGDGGGLDDLLGAGVIGREKKTRHWLCWSHAWANRKVLKLRAGHRAQASGFRTGRLADDLQCAGRHDRLRRCLREGAAQRAAAGKERGRPRSEQRRGDDRGAEPPRDEGRDAAAAAAGPGALARMVGDRVKLDDGTFFHGGTALMNWVVGNAKVESKGNAILITKQMAGRAKIDPLIAVGCAAILMSWNPTAAFDLGDFLANAVMR
jgi:phage terminase large subunit-like protein